MKFSEQWLREWVNPTISSKELEEQLTMLGLEVDEASPVANFLQSVVVGYVVNAEQHPDADRLKVCRIDIGKEQPLTIVCGGKNVATGQKVPVVLVDGQINDFKIKKAKLRGIVSEGMICSTKELGISEVDEGGIMELPADAPIGESVIDYLRLNDVQFELGITPNRGDCLSILGLAREVAAVNRMELQHTVSDKVTSTIDDTFPVILNAPDACPYYVGRIIRNVDTSQQTPLWMVEKLRRSGIRSISPVVDVTNYVMLELGQPLHAFDRDKLTGKIQVRLARKGETLTLLDNKVITLQEGHLIIADDEKPLALAGVMGGLDSSVTDATKDIFLEAAHFTPSNIAGVARSYGLHTDSSYRFERGVDPNLPEKAIERATELLLDIVAGEAGKLIIAQEKNVLQKPAMVTLKETDVPRLLGIELEKTKIVELLTSLGFSLKEIKEGWEVTVPSYRFDISQPVDLLEEIARLYGYNAIKPLAPEGELALRKCVKLTVETKQLLQGFIGRGFQEVITYSFTDDAIQKAFSPDKKPVPLKNPLSPELGFMRTSLWPGLIEAMQYNEHRQQPRLRIFEIGRCFYGIQPEQQKNHLAGLVVGDCLPSQWGVVAEEVDFYDVKSDLLNVLSSIFPIDSITFEPGEHPALHPGQSAQVLINKTNVGWIGRIHPRLQKSLKLKQSPILFEIVLEQLEKPSVPLFKPLSKYPSVQRDLALLLPLELNAAEVIQTIKNTVGKSLQRLDIFDLYQGEGVPEDRKSMAVSLTLQANEKTLEDEEVEKLVADVLKALYVTYNITLRE